MVQYDVKCPKRGHENKDLYLEVKRGGVVHLRELQARTPSATF